MIGKSKLSKELREIADRIDQGTCGLSDEELLEVSAMIMRRKLNIEQVCQRFGISRATLNRWQTKGKLPPFRKDSGGKDYLFQDEVEECLRIWREKHPED